MHSAGLTAEVPTGVVFGRNGDAIPSGWPVVPVIEDCGQYFFVNSVTQTFQKFRSDHIALLVDGDLHDYVALNAGRDFRFGNRWIDQADFNGRSHVRAGGITVQV